MGMRINEVELDEFEKLLGEIPNITSGAPSSEQFGLTNALKGSIDPTIGTLNMKPPNGQGLDEEKLSGNKIQQSHINRAQHEEPKLPDDQSLTSAFAELHFNDGTSSKPASLPLIYYASLEKKQTDLSNGQCPHGLQELHCNLDYPVSLGPSFGSQNNSCCSFVRVDPGIGFLDNASPVTSAGEHENQTIGYDHQSKNFSGALPFTHGIQGFQFLPNVHTVQGLDFPIFPDQQQCYSHSQRLRQPHMTWRPMEEDQNYRMHQQHLSMQRLRSQCPIQANGNMTSRLMSQNVRNLPNDIPFSNYFELSNQEALWNKSNVPRGIDFGEMQDVWKQEALAKSLGRNSLRSTKLGSFGGNEVLSDVNQNGRVFSNGHYNRISSNLCANFNCNNLRPLLQKYNHNPTDEIAGQIYFMAKDQNGCRFLQRKFTEGAQEDLEMIFSEIIMHVVELMTDPFGNYLVQKLLEVCNEDQRIQILRAITMKSGDLVRISSDMHGTRAVQKIIETLKTPDQFSLFVSSLKPGIVTLMKNINGNHVAQRCLQYLMPEYIKFVFEAAIANCVELATDRHGCCVLQKCLSHSDGDKRHRLMCEIISNALILSQDKYGNYVVQFVLKTRVSWAISDVLDQLEGNYGDLAMQKYSSNVVEKSLKNAKEDQQSCIIQELISDRRFDQILQDPYGNYVIQAAVKCSKGTLHGALVEAIRPHVPLLRTSPYGKKVLQAIA